MVWRSRTRNLSVALAIGVVLAGCASSPHLAGNHRSKFHVGRPNYTVAAYQVNGVWYYPKVDYGYDETGTASWYGEQFDQRPTSDGEIFDMNQLSAAHKTLPLPSVVDVTNLQNGRELRLRVNDRGPFVDGRLIDLSRRAAQLLGFERSGTAPVRVKIVKDESIQVAAAAMRGEYGPVGLAEAGQGRPAVVAAAAPPPRRTPPPAVQMAAVSAPPPRREPLPPVPVAAAPVIAPSPAILQERPAAELPPRRPAYAASSRRAWPSLIASAHADTLYPSSLSTRHPTPIAARNPRVIFIQAGAFSVLENAQRVRARIATLGSVEVVPTAGRGGALYRVRLGPLASDAQAVRLLSKVVDRGYPGARVVAE